MPKKDLVTREMMDKILALKNDRRRNYSFREIALELFKEFGVKVTGRTVNYHYLKHNKTHLAKPKVNIQARINENRQKAAKREAREGRQAFGLPDDVLDEMIKSFTKKPY